MSNLTSESVLTIFGHEGMKSLIKAFPGGETEILKKLQADVPNMEQSHLYETCMVITSWASDAQHHLAFVGDGDCEQDKAKLNDMKKQIFDIVGMLSYHDFTFASHKAFQEKYTDNY